MPHLRRVGLYLDDADAYYNHRWAGELLALEEINAASPTLKIDRWRGLRGDRADPEAPWWTRCIWRTTSTPSALFV